MFVPQLIFTYSIPLKQTDRTCWWIQIEMYRLNRFKCWTWHKLNSLWMFCLMWSSTFKLGLGIILVHRCCFMWTTETLPSWWVFLHFPLWNVISTVSQMEYSVNGLFSAMFETSDLGWITSLCSQVDYPQVGQGGQTSCIPCIKGMCDRCK